MRDQSTLRAVLDESRAALDAAGIEGALREARLLLSYAGRHRIEDQLAGRVETLSDRVIAIYRQMTHRRAQGEPLSRIRGSREFWSLEFDLSSATLDPRADSECLVEAVLEEAACRKMVSPSILDLGTGSGCLLVALLSELPGATGLGVDISGEALDTARRNAGQLGVGDRTRFVEGDWGVAVDRSFDIVVANPPYVATGEIATLAPEVRLFDPVAALDGGSDGLDCYRQIAVELPHLVAPEGFAALEIGYRQRAAVEDILAQAAMETVAIRRDLSGIERCIVTAPGLGAGPKKGLD